MMSGLPGWLRRGLIGMTFGGVLTGAFIAATGHAEAQPDTTTLAFLQVLEEEGIPMPSDSLAVALGNAVCVDLEEKPTWAISDAWLTVYEGSLRSEEWPDLRKEDAAYFVGASVQAFCPNEYTRRGEDLQSPVIEIPQEKRIYAR